MSQVTQPGISITSPARSHRGAVLAGLVALAATAAVVLALALVGNSDGTAGSVRSASSSQPSVRSDGGPEESGVAASVGSRPSAVPDESSIASSIAAGSTHRTGGPDESVVASSVSGRLP